MAMIDKEFSENKIDIKNLYYIKLESAKYGFKKFLTVSNKFYSKLVICELEDDEDFILMLFKKKEAEEYVKENKDKNFEFDMVMSYEPYSNYPKE